MVSKIQGKHFSFDFCKNVDDDDLSDLYEDYGNIFLDESFHRSTAKFDNDIDGWYSVWDGHGLGDPCPVQMGAYCPAERRTVGDYGPTTGNRSFARFLPLRLDSNSSLN